MRLAFYNARKTTFSHLIFAHQYYREKFKKKEAQNTHVEAFFDDGMMYGSSEIDGGVRSKYMREFKDHWEFIDLNLSVAEEKFCREWLNSKLGLGYDRSGIAFAQALKTNWFLKPEEYFCSELITDMIQSLMQSDVCTIETFRRYSNFIGIAPHMVSVARLYAMIKQSLRKENKTLESTQ